MTLLNLVRKQRLSVIIAMTAWAFLAQTAPAGIPSGEWQVHVSDPTNHVWDASLISPLQSPVVEFLDDDTTVYFDAPFTQNGSGKLVGAGDTEIEVASPILYGSVDGQYVTRGTVTSAKGIARLTYSSSAKGTAIIAGQPRAISSSFVVKAAIDSTTQTAFGVYAATAAAAGYGALKDAGEVDFAWDDVIAAMGDGTWILHLSLTNDAVKKVGGIAAVDLSGGRTLGFTVKGTYNAKTDGTILVLTADADSKGSSLKVTLNANGAAALQGKLTGQAIKAVGTLEPD